MWLELRAQMERDRDADLDRRSPAHRKESEYRKRRGRDMVLLMEDMER